MGKLFLDTSQNSEAIKEKTNKQLHKNKNEVLQDNKQKNQKTNTNWEKYMLLIPQVGVNFSNIERAFMNQ